MADALLSKYSCTAILIVALFGCSCNLSDQKESPGRSMQTTRILDSANNLLDNGQIKQSDIYLDSAYRVIPAVSPADLWGKYNHKVNFYLNYEFDLKKARLYSDSMSAIVKEKRKVNKNEYAWTFFTEGDVLMAEQKYPEAFKSYYDGRIYAEKNLDSCSLAPFTNQLGLVRYRQTQFSEAIPYLKRALEENTHCQNNASFNDRFNLPQDIMNTLALCYEQLRKRDSAIFYYRMGLTFISRQEPYFPKNKAAILRARGVFYGNLGGVYEMQNAPAKAEYYLKESIRINDRPGFDVNDAATAKLKLASLYIRESKFRNAANILDQIETQLRTMKDKKQDKNLLLLTWYKVKWACYNKAQAVKQAYIYQVKFYAFSDSLKNVEMGMRQADMDVVFRESEQQYKLALIGKENELKTGYLTAAVLFLLIAVGVLLAVWQNRKRLKTLNEKVTAQNADMHTTLSALQQSQEENTRLMKIVAHDLRSPMAATISTTTMLLQSGNFQPEDAEMLELMKTSSLHSLEMIADLLNMNTTAEGLKKEFVEMHTLLYYCVNLLNFKAAEKKQKITLQTPHIVLNVSREKIWRVVSNLLVNAIKFSPEGSAIEVGMQQQENFTLITIQDHGIGIPEKLKAKVFNMFTDARRPGTQGEQSFGLGLAISRQIVEAHGGRIWFESGVGQGTIFYVELPGQFPAMNLSS